MMLKEIKSVVFETYPEKHFGMITDSSLDDQVQNLDDAVRKDGEWMKKMYEMKFA